MNITAIEFINTIFFDVPNGETPLVARPFHDGEFAGRWQQVRPTHAKFKKFSKGNDSCDWYFGIATVADTDKKSLKRRKQDIRAIYCVVLDDIGTKCDVPPAKPSWIMETSSGNFQYGYLLTTAVENHTWFEIFMQEIGKAGFADTGTLDSTRIMRVPGSINVKEGRDNFASTLKAWEPGLNYELKELAELFDVKIPTERSVKHVKYAASAYCDTDLPEIADPVLDWLQAQGLVRGKQGNGYYEIQCPWHHEHSDGRDEAGYKPLGVGAEPEYRLFKCHHSHDTKTIDFLDWVHEQSGIEVGAYDPVSVRASIDDLATALGVQPIEIIKPSSDLDAALEADYYTWEQSLPIDLFTDVEMFGAGKNKELKPLVTARNMRSLLALHNVTCEFNCISRESDIYDGEVTVDRESFEGELYSQLVVSGFANAGAFSKVLPSALASRTVELNPVKDWLDSVEWDGVERLGDLCDSIQCADKDAAAVRDIVIPAWLTQCVHAGIGNNQGESNVLIFSGAGGIGKTQFFKNLVPDELRQYLLTGASVNPAHKDDVMKVCANWLVELGELGATFKRADMEALKAFITDDTDTYRVPYAKTPKKFKRHTTFCATVNDATFLSDSTGGGYRRWWVVNVVSFDWGHEVDLAQLWAEVYAKYLAGKLSPELTSIEAAVVEGEAIAASLDSDDDMVIAFHKLWPSIELPAYANLGITHPLTERQILDMLPDAEIAASTGHERKMHIRKLRAYLRVNTHRVSATGRVKVSGNNYQIHSRGGRQHRWRLPVPKGNNDLKLVEG